jgi:hypothetical protein
LQLAALLTFAPAVLAQYASWGNPCSNMVIIQPQFGKVTAIARCTWTLAGVQDNRVTVTGDQTLTPNGGRAFCRDAGYCGTFLVVDPYTASTSYTSTATFKASQLSIEFASLTTTDTKRTDDPIRPRTAGECELRPWLCDPNYFNTCPLLVNVGKGPWTLTSTSEGVEFDLDADGNRNHVSWTPQGSTLAFVAVDLNRNGRIDDGSELFGESMLLADGTRAPNGFAALAVHDRNKDGRIDAADAIWPRLLLWTDVNHDGISQSQELSSMEKSPVIALETSYTETNRRDRFGNELRFRSTAHMQKTGPEPYFDIFFSVER